MNARENYLTTAFIVGSDQHRYGLLIKYLEGNYDKKKEAWPQKPNESYTLFCSWNCGFKNILNIVQEGAGTIHKLTGLE